MKLLLPWMREWDLSDKLIYKKAAENQAIFIRDDIGMNLLHSRVFIVSTHTSKSCLLPVYYIKMQNGIKLIMRGNFYDWKISVEIPENFPNLPKHYLPEDCITGGIDKKISDCYLEGFKNEWGYDAYNPENPGKKFTIEAYDTYHLYVIIHALKNAYPDIVFKAEDDKRSKEEIVKSIEKMLDDNGFNEIKQVFPNGRVERHMSGWEILRKTYRKVDDLCYTDKVCEYEEIKDACEQPEKLAGLILKYPSVHEAFLMEEFMFEGDICNPERM